MPLYWRYIGSIFVVIVAVSSLAIMFSIAAVFLSTWVKTWAALDIFMALVWFSLFGSKYVCTGPMRLSSVQAKTLPGTISTAHHASWIEFSGQSL